MDLYGPLLARALFPAFEAARGRPTVPLTRYLRTTERWSVDQLRDLQAGFLRRLLRHAYLHTPFYRERFDERGLRPEDLTDPADLEALPLLDRTAVRNSIDARTADAPPFAVIQKSTSGSSGQPVTVKYNAESQHWRDATKWRGYGWSGYRLGSRALHYWGFGPKNPSWLKRQKIALDHLIKRDKFVDCTPRGPEALAAAVEEVRAYKPDVIISYAAGIAALARYVNEQGVRDWKDIPVLTGAERLFPGDRDAVVRAFGPAFETYGCREVMLIGSECEAHAGLHTSMETMIVEIIVRDPDGSVRAAKAGESGEVAVTDLHNLACPMIRYLTGDRAVAHGDDRCACGRGLVRIGPIEGRVTDTMYDGAGNAVGGIVFNILFGVVGDAVKTFQVIQHKDRSITLKVVPMKGDRLPATIEEQARQFSAKYLPGCAFALEYVGDIPLTAAGKRKIVVIET